MAPVYQTSADALARRILTLRRGQKLSQEAVAVAAGISGGYLSLLESGLRNPSDEVLEALADVLRTSVMHLRFGVGQGQVDDLSDDIQRGHIRRAAGRPAAAAETFTGVLQRATTARLPVLMQQAALGLAATARTRPVGAAPIAALQAAMAAATPGGETWVRCAAALCRCRTANGAISEAIGAGEAALSDLGDPDQWSYITIQLALAVLEAHRADGDHTYARILAEVVAGAAARMDQATQLAVRTASIPLARTEAEALRRVEETLSQIAADDRSRLAARAKLACATALVDAGPEHAKLAMELLADAQTALAGDDPDEAAQCHLQHARAQILREDFTGAVAITTPLVAGGLPSSGPLMAADIHRTHAIACLHLGRRQDAAAAVGHAEAALRRVPPALAARGWAEAAICHELLGDQGRCESAMRHALANLSL